MAGIPKTGELQTNAREHNRERRESEGRMLKKRREKQRKGGKKERTYGRAGNGRDEHEKPRK